MELFAVRLLLPLLSAVHVAAAVVASSIFDITICAFVITSVLLPTVCVRRLMWFGADDRRRRVDPRREGEGDALGVRAGRIAAARRDDDEDEAGERLSGGYETWSL